MYALFVHLLRCPSLQNFCPVKEPIRWTSSADFSTVLPSHSRERTSYSVHRDRHRYGHRRPAWAGARSHDRPFAADNLCHRLPSDGGHHDGGYLLWRNVRWIDHLHPPEPSREAASVVTCIDGYQMAKKGRAGAALGIAAIGSFIAEQLPLSDLPSSPAAGRIRPRFRPARILRPDGHWAPPRRHPSGGSIIKGLIILIFGLVLAMVGLDPISGKIRFTFGSIGLQGGFDFVTMAMGVFGLGEILYNLESKMKNEIVTTRLGKSSRRSRTGRFQVADIPWCRYRVLSSGSSPAAARSSPRSPPMPSKKKYSSHPEEFGLGVIEGWRGPSRRTMPRRVRRSSRSSPWESRETPRSP